LREKDWRKAENPDGGFVHLTKSFRLKMLHFLCAYQKQNTFTIHWLWLVLLFFRTTLKKSF